MMDFEPPEDQGATGNSLADNVPPNIRNVAYEIAGSFYDQNRSPKFRECAPDQDTFAIIFWPQFVNMAIECLVTAMTMCGIPESEKVMIAEEIATFRTQSVAWSLSNPQHRAVSGRPN